MSSKRIMWTIFMALVGFFIGGKGGVYTYSDFAWLLVITLWAAAMGLGIGTLVDRTYPPKHLRFYWAMTLALLFALVGMITVAAPNPYCTKLQVYSGGLVGAVVGIALGSIFGAVHQKRRRSRAIV
jgi:peptidoglycan/LPS O-acetylase OafA/YrhL